MLTDSEIDTVTKILEIWPGGMGCILVPGKTKRGYKTANWGWRGRKFGNFDYGLVTSFENAILCPVTAVGVMRYAIGFEDHMKAYNDIRETLEAALKIQAPKSKLVYNYMLSHYPRSLGQIFWHYKRNAPIKGYPLQDVVGGDFVELDVGILKNKKTLQFPVYVKETGSNTIRLIDKDEEYYRSGRPVDSANSFIIKEYHAH
jgi:hypothetical protein